MELVYCQQPTQFLGPASCQNPLDGASEHFTKGSRNLFSCFYRRALLQYTTEQPALRAEGKCFSLMSMSVVNKNEKFKQRL